MYAVGTFMHSQADKNGGLRTLLGRLFSFFMIFFCFFEGLGATS